MLPAFFLLLPACFQQQNDSDKTDPNDTRYQLTVDGEKISILHHDENHDGIVDAGESLVVQAGGQPSGQMQNSYVTVQQSNALPDFRGKNIRLWFEQEKKILRSEDVSSQMMELYEKVRTYAEEKGVDFDQAIQTASQIKTYSEKDRVQALAIAVLLMGLQTESHPFTAASEDNKKMVQDCLRAFASGEIYLIVADDAYGSASFRLAGYDKSTNTIRVMPKHMIDITDVEDRATLVHECTHLWQDVRRWQTTIEYSEHEADLKQGEYVYQTELKQNVHDKKELEQWISDFGEQNGGAFFPSVRLAFHADHQQQAEMDRAADELHTQISFESFVMVMVKADDEEAYQLARTLYQQDAKAAVDSARVAATGSQERFGDYLHQLSSDAVPNFLDLQLQALPAIHDTLVYAYLNDFYQQSLANPEQYPLGVCPPRASDQFANSTNSLLREIAKQKPAHYAERNFDGIPGVE